MGANYTTFPCTTPALKPWAADLSLAGRYFAEARKCDGAEAEALRNRAEAIYDRIELATEQVRL